MGITREHYMQVSEDEYIDDESVNWDEMNSYYSKWLDKRDIVSKALDRALSIMDDEGLILYKKVIDEESEESREFDFNILKEMVLNSMNL